MKKINLRADKFKSQKKSGGMGIPLFGGALLFVSLIFYGWFYFQNESVKKQISSTKEKIIGTEKDIQHLQFEDVYNFEKRLFSLQGQMSNFIDKNSNFGEIASVTYPEAYFDKIKVTSSPAMDSYEATLIVPDLLFLAKQIKAYETLKDVKNVDFGEVAFVDGGVSTNLSFDIIYREAEVTNGVQPEKGEIQPQPTAIPATIPTETPAVKVPVNPTTEKTDSQTSVDDLNESATSETEITTNNAQ